MACFSFRLTPYMMIGDFVNNISHIEQLQQVRQESDLPKYLWQCVIVDILGRMLNNDKHIVTLLSVHPPSFSQFNTSGAPLGLEFAPDITFASHLRIFLTSICLVTFLNLLVNVFSCSHEFHC